MRYILARGKAPRDRANKNTEYEHSTHNECCRESFTLSDKMDIFDL